MPDEPGAGVPTKHEAAALRRIEELEDPSALRVMMQNAENMGSRLVYDAAFRLLIEVLPDAAPGTVEHAFWRTIHAFEETLTIERGKTTRLSRTRQKVGRVGVKKTLEDFCTAKTPTEGFHMLIDRGLPELTGEAVVLRHRAHFPKSVTDAANARLEKAGVDVAALAGELSKGGSNG